jgi:hypothetical protein
MMELNTLTSVFGWMSVINIGLLVFSTIMLTLFRAPIIRIHQAITGLGEEALKQAYLNFIAYFKLLIIVFNLVPYIALTLI